MKVFILSILFSSLLFKKSNAEFISCNKTHGPPGDFGCYRNPAWWNNVQWIRCVSRETYDKYVDEDPWSCKSNYCELHCTTEYYGPTAGRIIGECNCNSTDIEGKKNRSKTLDDECYQPKGDDCSWYRNCLAKRYDCDVKYVTVDTLDNFSYYDSPVNYAINYGEKFCKLYDETYDKFSNEGQQWVDNVRKCLQNSLAPYIRPWSDSNCDEIEKIAFDSHTPCYVKPGSAKGYCSLSKIDQFKVFVTIKKAFLSEFSESINGAFGVMKYCWGSLKDQLYDEYKIGMYKLVYYQSPIVKNNLAIKTIDFLDNSNKLSIKLSEQLNLNQNKIDVYTFIEINNNETNQTINAQIMLTNLGNLFNETDLQLLAEINEKITELVNSDKLDLDLDLNDNIRITPSIIQRCQNLNCKSFSNSLSLLHTAHKDKNTTIYVVVSLCLIVIGCVFFYIYRKYKRTNE